MSAAAGARPALPGARALLREHGLSPRRALGQNFLVDDAVRERIVELAAPSGDDVVVEIGAGLGALTFGLAARARKVFALEADRALALVLAATLDRHGVRNVELVVGDALDFDLVSCALQAGRPLVVVGNLPYQITSPVLFKTLEAASAGPIVARALFMMQKEVALRMAARPGTREYGRLSVMVQQQAEVRPVLKVGTRAFLPPPAVLSTVVELTPRARPLAPVRAPEQFERVVRAAFSGRRKMLRNALEGEYGKVAAGRALAAAAIDGARRAETLAVAEFARLADLLPEDGLAATTSASG